MSLHEITPSLPPSNYIVEKSTRTEDDQSLNSRETSGFKAQTTRDEATISPEAKLMLGMGEGGGESAKIGRWYKHVSLKKEDFAGMEDAMAMLKRKKVDARDSIRDLLEKNGVKLSGPDNLKIELNANGQAIVGGVKDAKTARKIEKLLNDSPDALKAIADYQKEERKLSAELKAKTGMSFADLKKHCENIDQGYVKVLKDRGVMYSKEEMLSFQDQDLYKVDPNLMNSIKDFIAPDHSGIDFSTDSKIISNPESVLKSEMMDFTRNIKKAFDGINFQFMENNKEMAAEELDAMMLRLDKVKISVDNEGGIVIEGKTAENADRDAVGKAIINGYITDQLQDNAIAGTRDEFKLAADHLLMYYDEQMEDADKNDRKLVTTFENSIVESHVSSPEMEKKLKDSVTEDVNEMVQDAGIELVNPLEVEVDKNGKIRVTNLVQQGLQTKLINDVMNQINAELQIAGHGGKNSQNSIMTVVDRIKENVNKLKVYQKGGAGQIMVNAKNIEIESDA